jgi:2'-5' RNA ligase
MSTRIQLSLYVPEPAATSLESVRRTLDPVQSSLIPAHVTLCREDELAPLENGALVSRLVDIPMEPVTLHFGKPEPFHEHGILLPCIAGEHEFIALREHVLGSRSIRRQSPHITLAHPRNPKVAGNCLANANVLPERISITFARINFIEQTGATPWRALGTFDIPDARPNKSFQPKPLRGSA